jgi:hypothetical protein
MMEERMSNGLGYAVLVLAVLAVGFASVNSYYAFDKYSQISDLTGFGTSGYVNVTVSTVVSVNFTSDTINWGVGSIDNGQNNASLLAADAGATVTRGNWSTTGIRPLSIENIGSTNVTLKLSSDKDASTLFGGTAAHRRYQLNVTSNDAGACNGALVSNLSLWRNPNTTSPGDQYCSQLGYIDTQDQVNISIILVIPYDGSTGALSSTLTATAAAAA